MRHHPHIVEFTECVIDPVSRTPSLIFKYLDHHLETRDYLEKIQPDDLKIFLINILKVNSIHFTNLKLFYKNIFQKFFIYFLYLKGC